MLKTQRIINPLDFKIIFSNLNRPNCHQLEVLDRVSEAQLQVGDNSNSMIWRLPG